MMRLPAGCAQILCYGWIIVGIAFILGLNKGGENLVGAGFLSLGLGLWGLYVTRPRND